MSCNYHGQMFGANYPDACCIDGYLWDEDSCDEPGGPLSSGGDIPCPNCNEREAVRHVAEEMVDEGTYPNLRAATFPARARVRRHCADMREKWGFFPTEVNPELSDPGADPLPLTSTGEQKS